MLLKLWKKLLVGIFIWAGYHLIRDILQDIFNIHNFFTEFLHYELIADKLPDILTWSNFFGFRKWITFPIEIFLLFTIPSAYRREKFSYLDLVILMLIIMTSFIYLVGYYFVVIK